MKVRTLIGIVTFLIVGAVYSWSAVPQTITYQGYLKDSAGVPVTGSVPMTFSLYSSTRAGSVAVWKETQSNVAVDRGIYSVALGSATQINLPFDTQYYLGIRIPPDAEMSPRQALTNAPYTFRAKMADGVSMACADGGALVYRSGAWQCGTVTTFPNSTAICVGTDCKISRCTPGWGDCNRYPADGCETDLNTSLSNCGTCDSTCYAVPGVTAPNVTCSAGSCQAAYAIQVNVSGLNYAGLVLQNNSADPLSIYTNGTYSFSKLAVNGSTYAVSVRTQPLAQSCQITNSSGMVNNINVMNISVNCACLQWWPDNDGDGYGNNSSTPISECVSSKQGYASRAGDCNDNDKTINPAAPEVCDHIDNNCNGQIDEGVRYCNNYAQNISANCCVWATKTQYDACIASYQASGPPRNVRLLPCVTPAQSFDPVYWLCIDPGEVCDNIDNNCNGLIDEGILKCGNPAHCVSTEVCNGQDDNCNGVADEGGVCGSCVWSYEVCDGCDNDCDGLADNLAPGTGMEICQKGDGSPGVRYCKPSSIVQPGTCSPNGGWGPCQ